MKAVVYTRYGPPGVLRLMEVETPAPKDDEVLVKVHAVSLNASDWETLRGKPLYSRIMGPFRPRHHILGSDIAGQVEAAGPNATLFQPGEQVFADILSHMGGFAEYVCVPESALARMPAGMTYEEAACLPQAGAIALQGLVDKGQVQPVRAENLIHGSDQHSCSSGALPVMLTGHVPAVHLPPDHAASRVAAAVPARGGVENRRDLDPAPPGRGPAAAAAAPPEAELGGPGPARGTARRDTKARRQGLRLVVTPDTIVRWHRDIV